MAPTDPTPSSLAEWTKNNFVPLLDRSSSLNLHDTCSLFFSRQPTLFVNGVRITAGGYTALLQRQFIQGTCAVITFENVVAVPTISGSDAAGSVGFFFTAKINGGPESRYVSSSVNIIVEQDATIEGSAHVDRRRVTNMNQIILDDGANPLVVTVPTIRSAPPP
ncbi:hypothetical protein NEOLEDRAFT_1182510 [Neolentinus lepideus HHB14362 ss-1]|uniref:Uncharacterized protein n=1 Tax=Neolentinus lepideus HHB14362 ss-1 TaxID=1314782 RepID=A0A165P2F2_9AGAM|nr:hypothetical protein NEOLEDRAFT_1182510 [Neolentinus lepideus HHB14362 ss-1]